MKVSVILHNIRSAHNVGSVFRTADGAGVSEIYLTGYTPTPTDRFGREDKEISKTSLGATQTVKYEVCVDILRLLIELKKEGKRIVCVEQSKDAVDYKTFVPAGDTVFIFGNEITGIEKEILNQADATIHIPMNGEKESLNVSVCVGIVLFYFQ